MGSHEEFLELCAAATAGELSAEEQAKLAGHLAICPDCLRAKNEYDVAAVKGMRAFAEATRADVDRGVDPSWSVEHAEEVFFKRLSSEEGDTFSKSTFSGNPTEGKRHSYRPSQIRWQEVWMPFAAVILLALALGIAAYRSGVKHGTDAALKVAQPSRESENSLEAQVSDAGYAHAQLQAKLADSAKIIVNLEHQLADQVKTVNSLKSAVSAATGSGANHKEEPQSDKSGKASSDEELSAAQVKLTELQETVEVATAQRDEEARQAAILEAKVNELTELVKAGEQALDQRDAEVAKQKELLEHDRDIRDLMGARDLYVAEVHDVSGAGTDKTYGRVFYTKGKSLIFYAYDLDAQPGVKNASSFQAWGRRGPDKQQALSLGVFYEDNLSKKRWVLKASDPKTLDDIDAVFVTVEPNGGSHHPSGKPLLFAYLRITPNHP
jgi:hypothetical protein